MTMFVQAAYLAAALGLTAVKDGGAQSPLPAARPESRTTDTVRVGCSGGYTGGGSGNTLMGHPPAELAPVLAALRRAFGDDRRMWP